MNKKLRKFVVLFLLGCLVCSPVFAEWKLSKGKNPTLTYDGICLYTNKSKQVDKEKLDFEIKVTFDKQRVPDVEFIPKHSMFGNKKNLHGFSLWEVWGNSIYDHSICDFIDDNILHGSDALNLLNAVVLNSSNECCVYKGNTSVYEFVVDNSELNSLLNEVNDIIDVPIGEWECHYSATATDLAVSVQRLTSANYRANYSDDYKIYSMRYTTMPASETTRFYNSYDIEIEDGSLFLSFYCAKSGIQEDADIKVLSTNFSLCDENGESVSSVELKPAIRPTAGNNVSYDFSDEPNSLHLSIFRLSSKVGFVELQTTISCDGEALTFTTKIPAEEFLNLINLGWGLSALI